MRLLALVPVALLAALAPAQPRYTPKSDPARLERIKKSPMPKVTQPILYNTPEADAVCAALEVFPPDNPWNTLVTDWPVHPRSKQIIATVGAEKPLRANPDMAFVIVPPNQKKVPLLSLEYKDESDPGPYPIPDNMPLEGWPAGYTRDRNLNVTLRDVQENKLKEEGDRHAIVVDPVNRKLYEFYIAERSAAGWKAAQASVFDLRSNKLRPDTWTSADAAGLPIFPAIIRHDELERGVIDHALRVTVRRSKRAYVYPATHFASRLTDADLPRMGERFRLRQDFDTSGFSRNVRTVLEALKRYGMFMADNGIEWGMSSTADDRVPVMHDELRRVKGSDFEVVVAPPGYSPPK
ncbi:hypothetical protein [Urbifossiella limnaea]|uniref:Uncharacterized protein n=1 Tax=Urbifossiella limnaea TaxID=2528023 RepID=A0A517XMZ9_9BACT|nr:hypothetical protein [Urbifossiella limnaea]QDU18881.1 hypothetical protein ETAA1_07770 [Urbifossiella limnaea]